MIQKKKNGINDWVILKAVTDSKIYHISVAQNQFQSILKNGNINCQKENDSMKKKRKRSEKFF